jgi:hypothetical protein
MSKLVKPPIDPKISELDKILTEGILRSDKSTKQQVKDLFLKTVKEIDLEEKLIVDKSHNKWYLFGAYDFGAKLSDRIKSL